MPQTILSMLGAPLAPSRLKDSLLVIVDAQNEYLDGALPLVGVQEAIGEIARLLERARAAGTPIVHIVHHAAPGAPAFAPDSRTAEIVADLKPRASEDIVVKHFADSFAATTLDAIFARHSERREIILVGFMTHNCILATAVGAANRALRTTIVASATATRDLPDGKGGVTKAEDVQRGVLTGLSETLAIIAPDARAIS